MIGLLSVLVDVVLFGLVLHFYYSLFNIMPFNLCQLSVPVVYLNFNDPMLMYYCICVLSFILKTSKNYC